MLSLNYPPCPFKCGYCKGNSYHVCRKCGMINDHRSSDCGKIKGQLFSTSSPFAMQTAKTGCIFNCGFCRPNQSHQCRTCNAINTHRTKDCPVNKVKAVNSTRNTVPCFSLLSNFHPTGSIGKKSSTFQTNFHPRNVSGDSEINNSSLLILIQRNQEMYIAVHVDNVCGRGIIIAGGDINSGEDPMKASKREAKEEQGFSGGSNSVDLLKKYDTIIKNGPRSGKSATFYTYVTMATQSDFDWRKATTKNEIKEPSLILNEFWRDCFPLGGKCSYIYAVKVKALLSSNLVYFPVKRDIQEAIKERSL